MQSASMDAKPPLLFYLSTNATQQHTCFTHWSERILSALAKHPWRTKSRSKADVLFLPSLETRFELNFPLFTGPRLAYRHYDARLCDGAKVTPYLAHAQRVIANTLRQQQRRSKPTRLVLFPPILAELADSVGLEWHHNNPHVTRALTAGAEVGIYRIGKDVSYPPSAMHLERPEYLHPLQAATAAATACAPTKHLLAFDGSTIRAHNMRDPIGMEYVSRYRSRLSRLHNPSEGVHIVVCAKRQLRANRQSQQQQGTAATGRALEEASSPSNDECNGAGASGSTALPLALNTTFALVPRGDMPYAYRLIEALAFGAIPVILSDEYVLPFSEILDWQAFSVRWPYARASSLVASSPRA